MKPIILLGIIATLVAFAHPETFQHKGGISPKLTFVATVGNISFYADASESRNWTEAAAYCKTVGLHLALITTTDQFDALSAAVVPEFGTDARYWTDGRDSQQIEQFYWDYLGTPLLPEFPLENIFNLTFQTCILFNKQPGNSSNLVFNLCSASHYTLCET